MGKPEVSTEAFATGFAVMVREGKSALEIGQALGFTGTDKVIAQKVCNRATVLRKRLKMAAQATAAKQGLSAEDTAKLVEVMESKLPRIKHRGRPSEVDSLVSAIDAVLARLDAVEPAEVAESTEETKSRRKRS